MKHKTPVALMIGLLVSTTLGGEPLGFERAEQIAKELAAISGIGAPVQQWRCQEGENGDGSDPLLEDKSWLARESNNFSWGTQSTAWLRTRITMPEEINGCKVKGNAVLFKCRVRAEDEGIIYVNGRQLLRFYQDEGRVLLCEQAFPGEKFDIAIQGFDTGKDGQGGLNGTWLELQAAEAIPFLLNTYSYAREMYDLADKKRREPYAQYIQEGMAMVDLEALRAGKTDVFLQSVSSATLQLGRLDEFANGLTIHLVGHAHIDMNWLWDWPETVRVCKNTFSTAAKLMDEYPDFIFSQSQAAVYLAMQENHPEVFEKIKEMVKRGQWDITATTWTEGDNNMSSGEAIVRSILYGKRYIKEQFGVESTVCWEPDTFGHPWTLPQILAKSGIKYYYFTRCPNGFPIFWWQGPDGSRVLAYRTISYDNSISDHVATDAVNAFNSTGLPHFMRAFGVGDHGGGPTRAMLEYAKRLQARPSYTKIKFDKVSAWGEAALKSKSDYQVWNNELNTVFEGCYTSHADIKRGNRESEALLPCAEKFAILAMAPNHEYPTKDFERSWRNVCFNQFHDLLCGTCIHDSYAYSQKLYIQAQEQAQEELEKSLKAIITRVDTRGEGVPIVVFNPLSWMRSENVEVISPFPTEVGTLAVVDAKGRSYPAQNSGDRLCFTAHEVPALGYKLFWARQDQSPAVSEIKASGSSVENQFFRVVVDPAKGALASIYDKLNRIEVVPRGEYGAKLQMLFEEPPKKMSAWNIGAIARQEELLGDTKVSLMESGPARVRIKFTHHYGVSRFSQDLILYDNVPRIDIKMTADWHEVGNATKKSPMLKAAFPVALVNPKATFEIPFGSIERPANGREVPAQKWIDFSQPDYGVSLLNNCKYGFDVQGRVMRITLLRCSYDPDPKPDEGRHEMTYAIYPHKGDWREAGTVRKGYELNEPLLAQTVDSHAGTLPPEKSFVSLSAPNVVLTALKQAEDGDGTILRFYEANGSLCQTDVRVDLPVKHYVETDLMEKAVGAKMPIQDGVFVVPVGKWEIKTYKLLP